MAGDPGGPHARVALIPVGAHEQHGPYLCTACDAVRALEFTRRLGERVYPLALVAPPVLLGVSPHHLAFPGTVSLRPETLGAVLLDIVDSLARHGVRKFLAVNGHGGNDATLGVVAQTLLRQGEVEFAFVNFKVFGSSALGAGAAATAVEHAGAWEVAMTLYLAPSFVRADAYTPGAFRGLSVYPHRAGIPAPRLVRLPLGRAHEQRGHRGPQWGHDSAGTRDGGGGPGGTFRLRAGFRQ